MVSTDVGGIKEVLKTLLWANLFLLEIQIAWLKQYTIVYLTQLMTGAFLNMQNFFLAAYCCNLQIDSRINNLNLVTAPYLKIALLQSIIRFIFNTCKTLFLTH